MNDLLRWTGNGLNVSNADDLPLSLHVFRYAYAFPSHSAGSQLICVWFSG